MDPLLSELCRKHEILWNKSPRLQLPSENTWIIEDSQGAKWIAKRTLPEDKIPRLLKSFSVMHPPFRYPQSVTDPAEPCLLYPFIEGEILADGLFEQPEIIEQVVEVVGRIQSLMRSLVLVPFYQEILQAKDSGQAGQFQDRYSLGRIMFVDDMQKVSRRKEMAESYQWMEESTREYCNSLQSMGLWSRPSLESFREQVKNTFSIHVPVAGSSLSHTACHPEHIIQCPDGEMGIVGWQVEPRPRFYMIYTYLAWSLLHSRRADPADHCRRYLVQNSSKAFYKDHHLVFAFCLLEQAWKWFDQKISSSHPVSERNLEEAGALFQGCIQNAAK